MSLKGVAVNGEYYAFDYRELDNKPLMDGTPSRGSQNLVSSGGVYAALTGKADASAVYTKSEIDEALEGYVGIQGPPGEKGDTGATGPKGEDGYSPSVSISEIQGGHRLTITDIEHQNGQYFDILDGKDGIDTSIYDPDGDVAEAGGIVAYFNHAVQEVIGSIVNADEVTY